MSELFPEKYINEYRKCIEFRALQLAIAKRYENQEMRCPIHLSIGQEYWLPLIKSGFRFGDRCFSSHRSHSMYMALGGNIERMISELYGSPNGSLSGYGGSMHLKDLEVGLEASIPIVGSSIPLAIGSAFAAKHAKKDLMTIAYFGDGACEEGVFHESLNLASLYNLPILFICENNSYSCNTHYRRRQVNGEMKRYAKAFEIKSFDIRETYNYSNIESSLSNALKLARDKPIFLEINSYRLYEHCGHRIDTSAGDRTNKEFKYYSEKDPIVGMLREYEELRIELEELSVEYDNICEKHESNRKDR